MTDLRRLLIFVAGVTCAFSVGCGGGSSSPPKTNTITQSGQNVAPITVNLGPGASQNITYANGAFASVTVCVPGTSTCQTIDGVLVDTGSSGLRILSSALSNITLPPQKTSSGNPVAECLQFLASYTWGPVETADVQIAGEKASAVPIQVLSDTDFTVPSACSNGSSLTPADTLAALGANGILGVGLFAQDCGSYCEQVQTAGNFNPYYECPSSGCQAIGESLAQQVANPVALFSSDNNGVIIELPAVSGAEATVTGSLVFGIGTQSNNGLGSATIYTVDPATGNFTTTFNGTTFNKASFIDSGSNGYFFPDPNITPCPTGSNASASGFYCPANTVSLSATNQGVTQGSGTVSFSIANAQTMFTTNPSDAVFEDLGGPTGNSSINMFDWGLPFFYGHNVYTAIDGATTPGGTGPYWAY
jgi:hypothetical protein